MKFMQKIINVAIIAHVDHGKTTLIDSILSQTGQFRENEEVAERAMDSNDLEKERGITILAKCTSINWKDYRINIVDTPGHADFGGEVERILSMVNGAIILVDAAEGPLPQTKFVLTKALKLGLKPIVVVNKVDRSDARIQEVLNEILELFLAVNATEAQLDCPTLYASGRNGWASTNSEEKTDTLGPLLDAIVENIPLANDDEDLKAAPFKMLATILEIDTYVGTLLTGKIQSGTAKVNMPIKALDLDGNLVESGRLSKIFSFSGLKRVSVDEANVGDIVIVAGLKKGTVTNTICALEVTEPIKASAIDPPTISISFSVNNSPLAGKEGNKCTSRMIGERLAEEVERNVALKVAQSDNNDSFQVSGRGELQLGILIETMRREGFELTIGRPKVIMQKVDGKVHEPIEEVTVDVDEEYVGTVVEQISLRKGIMQDMFPTGTGKNRIIFEVPTRGLIGYHSQFLTDTRGTGVMNRLFKCYDEYKGPIAGRRNGVLTSNDSGDATAYSLFNLEDRGKMMIRPGEKVYQGMIIGEHSKDNDLDVNIIRGKQLTNVRASGKDDAIKCTTPIILSLEESIAYIQDDEVIEVTPKSIRLRKRYLDPNERRKAQRSNQDFEL